MSSSNVGSKTESLRRRVLRYCYWEGAFWALMTGIAENYGLFYAVKRGLSPHEVALLTTVPMFLGALSNWLSPWIFRRFSQLKLGIIITASIQVVGLGCLVWAVKSEGYVGWVFWGLCLYWMGGLGATPLWIDWMSAWLPQERFGRFYSRRTSTLAIVTLVAFMGTSLWIARQNSLHIFLYVFGLAFLARVASVILLAIQPTPRSKWEESRSLFEKPRVWSWRSILIFMGAAAIFKFVVNLSSPFVLPYMVKTLDLSIFDIAIANGAAYFGIVLMVTSFAEAMRNFRPIMGFQIMMILAALNCLAWSFVRDLVSISFLQFLSGFTWAVFDLACILIFQANFPGMARQILGIHMSLSGLAVIAGSYVGARLLDSGVSYIELFWISGEWRLIVALIFFLISLFLWRDYSVPLKDYRGFLKTALWPRIAIIADFQRLVPMWKRRRSH